MGNLHELKARVEDVNKRIKVLNQKRNADLGRKSAYEAEFKKACEEYKAKYGVVLTAETVDAEFKRVTDKCLKDVQKMEEVIGYIDAGEISEAERLLGIQEVWESSEEVVDDNGFEVEYMGEGDIHTQRETVEEEHHNIHTENPVESYPAVDDNLEGMPNMVASKSEIQKSENHVQDEVSTVEEATDMQSDVSQVVRPNVGVPKFAGFGSPLGVGVPTHSAFKRPENNVVSEPEVNRQQPVNTGVGHEVDINTFQNMMRGNSVGAESEADNESKFVAKTVKPPVSSAVAPPPIPSSFGAPSIPKPNVRRPEPNRGSESSFGTGAEVNFNEILRGSSFFNQE